MSGVPRVARSLSPSHQLNRDTWAHDTVAQLVAGSMVFLQLYDTSEGGRKVLTFYVRPPTCALAQPGC